MKKSLKILSVMLSAVMLFSLAFSVPASAADYAQTEVNKAGLECAMRNTTMLGGGYVTPESLEAYKAAHYYAAQVYDDPNATQQEVDAATEMLYSSYLVDAEFDTDELHRYYFIVDDLYDNHLSEFTDESQKIIDDVLLVFYSYVCQFKCYQSQVDEMTQEFKTALSQLVYVDSSLVLSVYENIKAKEYADAYMMSFDFLGGKEAYTVGEPLNYKYGSYVVLPAYYNCVEAPMLLELDINGYHFSGGNSCYVPSMIGYVAVNLENGEVFDLEEALNGRIDIDNFYEYYKTTENTYNWMFKMTPCEVKPDEVDKSILNDTLNSYAIAGGGYVTPESYKNYNATLNYAIEVRDNPGATQEEVDNAVKMMLAPENQLVSAEYDTAELDRTYNLCNELNTTYKDYLTDESKEIIKTALLDFYMYACSIQCSQAEVDEMTAELKAAVNKVEYDFLPYARNRAQGFVQAYCDKISEEIPGGGYKLGKFSDYNYGQYLLIQAENLMPAPILLNTRIDGYLIENNKADMGYLAVNYITGEVMPLESALEKGLIDIDDFYKFYQPQYYESDDMKFVMCVIGDCDYDSELTVKDATLIQEGIVGLLSIDALKLIVLERDNQADVNHDGEVDVKDATLIQKKIVGLE